MEAVEDSEVYLADVGDGEDESEPEEEVDCVH
jgi:hypothetical protein